MAGGYLLADRPPRRTLFEINEGESTMLRETLFVCRRAAAVPGPQAGESQR